MVIPVAVASSVAADNHFDNLDALSYAIAHGFSGFQAYITAATATNQELLAKIAEQCQAHDIRLIVHLPDTLTREMVENETFNNAVRLLYKTDSEMRVVHHYDEHLSIEDALENLATANRLGITVCLENFFKVPGGINPVQSFQNYLILLQRAKDYQVIPVFDIPRLYDERLGLSDELIAVLWRHVLSILQDIKLPLILHLIDGTDIAGRQWCPIGQGKIPYQKWFSDLLDSRIPIDMIILEYEDRQNPLDSREFLRLHMK